MKGLLLVVSGPSGVGKSTVIKEMMSGGFAGCECFFSVSMTTRAPRQGETDGVNYHFVTHDRFREDIEKGRLLEYAQYDKDFYGTPAGPVEEILSKGGCAILDIEVQGMMQARAKFPDMTTVFVKPPSWDELETRLRNRGSETEERLQKRLSIARRELEMVNEYKYLIVNGEVKTAALDLAAIIRAEKLRI